jgi:hypothetical protein
VRYLVRDDYFEPERGHRAERGVAALTQKWAQRRACLLETHRSNFIGDVASVQQHLAEIDRLYGALLAQRPDVRFISTEEWADAMRQNNPAWIESRLAVRLSAWLARARAVHGYWKMARLTGLSWLMGALGGVLRQ